MYNNIGNKIMTFSKVFFVIGVIFSMGFGLAFYQHQFAVIYFIFGPVISWIVSLFLYGFGKLVQNSTDLNDKLNLLIEKPDNDEF